MSQSVVERGTCGSWLIVDCGEDSVGRRALERFSEEPTARREAGTLAGLDDFTAGPPAPVLEAGFDAMFAAAVDHGQAIDVVHNFDHIVRARP